VVDHRRLAHRLHVSDIASLRQRIARQIKRTRAGLECIQRHQVLAIDADVHHVMIDGVLVSSNIPLQRRPRHLCRDAETVIDTRFDFSALLVVVPSHELERIQLLAGVVEAINFREGLEPGLAALLSRDAVRTPRCQGVVETFVDSSDCVLLRRRQAGLVKLRQIAHPKVGDVHDDPGIAPATHGVGKTTRMLKDEIGVRAGCRSHCFPIDDVMQIDVEICDHRPPIDPHVRGRWNVSLFDVLHLMNQGLLRVASSARA